MITIEADKIKPNPIFKKTKDTVCELGQHLNYGDALEALAAVCKIHNSRPDVGTGEDDVPAMDHDQILKDIKTWYNNQRGK